MIERDGRFGRTVRGLATVAVLAFLAAAPAQADEIWQKDGAPIRNVTIEKATYVTVSYIPAGVRRAQEIAADEVGEIRWSPANNNSLIRGVAAFMKGDHADAENRLSGATKLAQGPEKGYARYMYARCLLALGKVDDAITELSKYTREFKAQKDFYLPPANVLLADLFLKQKKYDKAEAAYKEIAGYGPAFKPDAELGRGKILLVKGDFEGARGVFSKLKSDNSLKPDKKIEAWLGYARAQLGLKQYGPAAETVRNQVVGKNTASPTAAAGYLVWGEAELAEAGSKKEKLEWAGIRFMRAAILSGNDPKTHVDALEGMQKVFEKLGDKARVEDLKKRIAKVK